MQRQHQRENRLEKDISFSGRFCSLLAFIRNSNQHTKKMGKWRIMIAIYMYISRDRAWWHHYTKVLNTLNVKARTGKQTWWECPCFKEQQEQQIETNNTRLKHEINGMRFNNVYHKYSNQNVNKYRLRGSSRSWLDFPSALNQNISLSRLIRTHTHRTKFNRTRCAKHTFHGRMKSIHTKRKSNNKSTNDTILPNSTHMTSAKYREDLLFSAYGRVFHRFSSSSRCSVSLRILGETIFLV